MEQKIKNLIKTYKGRIERLKVALTDDFESKDSGIADRLWVLENVVGDLEYLLTIGS